MQDAEPRVPFEPSRLYQERHPGLCWQVLVADRGACRTEVEIRDLSALEQVKRNGIAKI